MWLWGTGGKSLIAKTETSLISKATHEQKVKIALAADVSFMDKQQVEEALASDNPYLKTDAIVYLEREGTDNAISKINLLLWDPTPLVVIEAASALSRVSNKQSAQELIAAFHYNKVRIDGYGESIREAIIDALGYIKSRDAVEILGEEFKAKGSLIYRDHIVDALSSIGGHEANQYLSHYLNYLIENPPPTDWPELFDSWKDAVNKVQDIIAKSEN